MTVTETQIAIAKNALRQVNQAIGIAPLTNHEQEADAQRLYGRYPDFTLQEVRQMVVAWDVLLPCVQAVSRFFDSSCSSCDALKDLRLAASTASQVLMQALPPKPARRNND